MSITKIWPDLVFGRLWQKMGTGEIIGKKYGISLNRQTARLPFRGQDLSIYRDLGRPHFAWPRLKRRCGHF